MAIRVLLVHTQHRGGGGTENYIGHWQDSFAAYGVVSDQFTRSSAALPGGLAGRLVAGFSALHAPASLRDFARKLDEFKPDIVHIYDLFPLISPWILKYCHERGIATVVYLIHYRLTCPVATHWRHGVVCDKCSGGKEHWAVIHNCRDNLAESITVALHNQYESRLRQYSKYVHHFIAPCEFVRTWISSHSAIPPERISTVEHLVSIPEYTCDPDQGRYVAFSGRFAQEKGLSTLLEAARLCPGIPFRLTRSVHFNPGIDLPSEVKVFVTETRAELEIFYRGARIGVMPSTWFETFGITGAEMMAIGLPVIVSRLGALTNLVDDGVDGLYFEPGNATDLAQKVKQMWYEPERCREMGLAGRHKAQLRWNERRHVTGTLEVYDRALVAAGRQPFHLAVTGPGPSHS